jgi:hypothetical protein
VVRARLKMSFRGSTSFPGNGLRDRIAECLRSRGPHIDEAVLIDL